MTQKYYTYKGYKVILRKKGQSKFRTICVKAR